MVAANSGFLAKYWHLIVSIKGDFEALKLPFVSSWASWELWILLNNFCPSFSDSCVVTLAVLPLSIFACSWLDVRRARSSWLSFARSFFRSFVRPSSFHYVYVHVQAATAAKSSGGGNDGPMVLVVLVYCTHGGVMPSAYGILLPRSAQLHAHDSN